MKHAIRLPQAGSNHSAVVPRLQHPVAHTDMGLDHLGLGRAALNLLAERSHEYTERRNVVRRTAPDFMQDIIMGQDLAHILRQQTQQLILNRRQVDLVTLQPDTARRIVNPQISVRKKGESFISFSLSPRIRRRLTRSRASSSSTLKGLVR